MVGNRCIYVCMYEANEPAAIPSWYAFSKVTMDVPIEGAIKYKHQKENYHFVPFVKCQTTAGSENLFHT